MEVESNNQHHGQVEVGVTEAEHENAAIHAVDMDELAGGFSGGL